MDRQVKGYGRFNNSGVPSNGDVFEPMSSNTAKQRATLVEWLNFTLPDINLPINASDEELRKFLVDGTILCRLLNKLKPGSVTEYYGSDASPQTRSENIQRFLSAMDTMGLPRFQEADLEKGSMRIVLDCLLTLRTQFMPNFGTFNGVDASSRWKMLGQRIVNNNGSQRDEPFRPISSPSFGDNRRTLQSGSAYQHSLRSPGMGAPSAAINHHVGNMFHEVFQLKQGSYTDLPDAKISEMMKSNSLDNAPTQSLLSVVNGILDESIERKNGEIPYRVACLLRKVVQEIERRISTQAEHLRTQNNLFKAREEKYQSRIRVLEALATGTSEETQIVMNQLQQIKNEKSKLEEKKKVEKVEVRLKKENDDQNQEIASLKEELEIARKTHEKETMQMKAEAKEAEQEIEKKLKEVVSQLTESKGAEQEIEKKLKEVISQLTESKNRVKELESFSESKSERWSKKEHIYHIFTEFQLGALRELKFASQSIRQEVVRTQKNYSEEFGSRIRALDDAAKNYYSLLAENRKMHNELQELKGNIRVYCRVRPFLPGQKGKQSIIEYVGENGELVVVNPSKQGKEGRKSFKFNKVYGQAASQAEVFSDTQPLIQSVLDGFNVCIFAYGQTGSGKTYTMTGPDKATEEDWGVNYRALNDLFRISQSRGSTFTYEISVQMVEIYNEQVRDLLSNDGPAKKIGIMSTVQPHGLALPDASIHPVNATSDVLKLMDTGLKNRAKGSTALNERSSRSHSVVSIHARGTDLKSGSSLRGSLHLVDLAGSERVDRSEVTGDRLKEAQHINKSLSALGDVIFALAQKSAHVPYRNSKLTQVLQSSLGGHAKTLMFVQLNPDSDSFSESISTLKFAERVSGVELGAAKSSKDGRDVRELMEQVTSLKDTIAKKDEEIERLQIVSNKEKRVVNSSTRYGSTSPSKNSTSETPQRSLKLSGGKGSESAASDHDDYSDGSDKHSINSSHQSSDDFRQQKASLRQTKTVGGNIGQNISDHNLGSRGDSESDERVSGKSDSVVLMGTGTEGSPESSPVPDHEGKSVESTDKTKSPSRVSRSRVTKSVRETPKISTGLRKSNSGTNLFAKPSPSRRWQ